MTLPNPTVTPLSTNNNIPISVKRSSFTLAFCKAACHANPGAGTHFAGSSSCILKIHISKAFKYIS